jgi:hypothetical protein
MERELLWYDIRAQLLEHHDSVSTIVGSYCIEVLIRLERFEKAYQLRNQVLQPLQLGDYGHALDHLQNFLLGDDAMFKLFPWLVDMVAPALELLDALSDEFEIP